MVMSGDQHACKKNHIRRGNKAFKKDEQCRYLGTPDKSKSNSRLNLEHNEVREGSLSLTQHEYSNRDI
jgi:hypothetical protein